jgi:hypothetical protein
MCKRRRFYLTNPRTGTGEDGIVLVIVAATLAVMIGFVALGVSTGYLFSARTDSQALADAAALGGASTFIFTPFATQPDTAEANAVAVALNQGAVMRQAVTAGDIFVDVDVVNRRVQVDVATTQPTFFARILGFNNTDVAATAFAEAAVTASASNCTKPWFIPSTLLMDPGQDMCQACAGYDSDDTGPDLGPDPTGVPGPPYEPPGDGYSDGPLLLYDTGEVDSNGDPVMSRTDIVWDLVQDYEAGTADPALDPIPMRPTTPTGAIAPGQFYSIVVEGPGGSLYEEAIASCVDLVFSCFDQRPVEPGAMVGPTSHGVDELTGSPPATMNMYGDGGGVTWDFTRDGVTRRTDRQLAMAPIWDACRQTDSDGLTYCETGAFESGRHDIKIVGFALIFIDGMQGNTVMGHLLDVVPCGRDTGGGGGGAPSESGILARPLNLVRIVE